MEVTVNRSFVLLAMMLISAMYIWNMFYTGLSTSPGGVIAGKFPEFMIIGMTGSVVPALITAFFKKTSPVNKEPLNRLYIHEVFIYNVPQ